MTSIARNWAKLVYTAVALIAIFVGIGGTAMLLWTGELQIRHSLFTPVVLFVVPSLRMLYLEWRVR